MNLHIGGKVRKEDWKVLDIQPGEHVDFIGDISDLGQFADGSCEKVYASHVLEHVRQQDVVPTLSGIRRILAPGGELLVSVPDWDVLCHLFISPVVGPAVKWHALQMILGAQGDEHDFHRVGFNEGFLGYFLQQAGFSSSRRVASFGLFADTSEYRPYGFPISLNVIATR